MKKSRFTETQEHPVIRVQHSTKSYQNRLVPFTECTDSVSGNG